MHPAPAKPLDHPYSARPHRVYVTLTNHCNRACPWCSTCSSPMGQTWLSLDACQSKLPKDGPFELQLEGGEPTLHPRFWNFVEMAQADARCTRLILCTNGVEVPRAGDALASWLARFGERFTLKLSINHYLLDHDSGLIDLAVEMRKAFANLGGDRILVLNVRLRKGVEQDEFGLRRRVALAGLEPHANIFYLQRYGFASAESEWDEPFLVGENFSIINPDGSLLGTDLIARSEAMRLLP